MRRLPLVVTGLLTSAALATAGPPPGSVGPPGQAAKDACFECHLRLDDARLNAPAKAAADDVHARQGVTCAGCHGGNPHSDDPDIAMSRKAGFVGVIPAVEIPVRCGACHADASFMLRYAPNIPTDQLAQYHTSKHGQALAKGDANVATCASCHGAHGVVAPTDARSPVYPTHIVDTCAHCPANKTLMNRYGISGDEVDAYRRSVHYAALVKKNDLSSPTCKSCHGAHGATPPGVESVANVCGTCHVTQENLFDSSPHKAAFAAIEQPACEACHSNHAILVPQDGFIGVGDKQVCGQCHSAGEPGAKAAEAIAGEIGRARVALAATEQRVQKVERAGMLMDNAEVQLEDAHQAMVLARNAVHTVGPGNVGKQTEAVLKSASVADRLADEAEHELHVRRTGLFVSLVIILVAIVALVAKIGQMER
jgi:predicted CXXCH cytochrome family protein